MADELVKLLNNNKERINWDQYFMSIAILASVRSSCDRLKVGCVLVKNKRVISMGYNGFLPNANHNSIIINNHEQATVHAEQNAISDAANRGISVNKSVAYITHYPCVNCFKILVASGIEVIKYLNDYKNDSTIDQIINDGVLINIVKISIT
jgi:dCMP deaminase